MFQCGALAGGQDRTGDHAKAVGDPRVPHEKAAAMSDFDENKAQIANSTDLEEAKQHKASTTDLEEAKPRIASAKRPPGDQFEKHRTLASLGLDAEILSRPRPPCVAERVHPDVNAVVYRGVLSEDECERVVASLSGDAAAWESKCSKKHVRDAEGRALPSMELAELLQARLCLPHGLPEEWRERTVRRGDKHLGDIGTEGTWAPRRVNDRIRATRYRPGGHFAPHRDGVIQPNNDERSFLTILLYLTSSDVSNDVSDDDSAAVLPCGVGFVGGETAFLRDASDLEYGSFDASADVIARVRPEAGLALVFRQDALHAGLPVVPTVRRRRPASDGIGDEEAAADVVPRKFIAITEVFYSRIAPPAAGEGWDPESVALLREAERHEVHSEFPEAIRCYNRLRRLDPEFARHAGIP